jgi:hypothetical protein
LIALGDSGRAVSVWQNGLAALLAEKDKPAPPPRWTVSVILPGKTANFADYTAMVSPAQAMEVANTTNPVTSVSTFGKGSNITLSSDALDK